MIRYALVNRGLEAVLTLASSAVPLAAVYLWTHPTVRAGVLRDARRIVRRVSGADTRAWLASPAAEFGRRRRDELVAAEMAE